MTLVYLENDVFDEISKTQPTNVVCLEITCTMDVDFTQAYQNIVDCIAGYDFIFIPLRSRTRLLKCERMCLALLESKFNPEQNWLHKAFVTQEYPILFLEEGDNPKELLDVLTANFS